MKYNCLTVILVFLCGFHFPSGAQNVIVDTLGFDSAMATTPAAVLKGRVPGLRVSSLDGNVNGAVSTLIRGVNTLRSDSQPLWIIDGAVINCSLNRNSDAFFQYGEKSFTSPLNALFSLNEYDVASIEVLKDLSATAIYGSKGANGVIIVNTKLPSKVGTRVGWTSNAGISFPEKGIAGTGPAFSHNHYLDVSGALGETEKTKYFVSAYFRKLNGVTMMNEGSSGGIRVSFDTKANSVVWFGMNTAISMGKQNSIAGVSYFGQPSLTMTMRSPDFFKGDTFDGWKSDYDDNADERRIIGSMYLTLNFTPALTLRTSIGLDFLNNNRYIWYGNGTSFGRENNGAASVLGSSLFKFNASSVLTWTRYIGTDHKIVAKAQVDASGDWTKLNTENGTDFFSHVLRARGLNLASSKPTLHKYDNKYHSFGWFADISYSFKHIAGINGTLRGDCTPRYDDSRFILYKAGSAWIDVRSAFFPSSKGISTLVVKGGYGEAGREEYVPYGLYGQFLPGTYPKVEDKFQMYFEGLNRVKSREFNAGIDMGFFSDRIRLYVGYYDKMTDDVFNAYRFGELKSDSKKYWHYCDRRTDFVQSTLISNRGFETSVNFDVLKSRDFHLNVYANGCYNANQLLRVGSTDDKGHPVGNGMVVNANVLGYTVGAFYGFLNDRDGNFADVTKDGIINEFDKCIIGNPNPKAFGGAGMTLSYKKFYLDVLATGAFGFSILNLNDFLLKGAIPYQVSEANLEKGDFVKIDRISVGCDLPVKRIKWINKLAVKVSALNLLTFSGYSGWNPEVNCFGTSSLSGGVDYGSYPAARSLVAGISINF